MPKYYVYAQGWSNSNIASCYDAYTDNPYIMKEFINQMDRYLKNSGYIGPCIRSDLLEIESENEDSLIKLLARMKIGFSMSTENKLWSITNEFNQTTVVTNRAIYSKFIETIIVSNEIRKIDVNLYRLSRPGTLTYITAYMREDVANEILKTIKLIYNAHMLIKEAIERDGGDYGILAKDRKESELWFIIDEGTELLRFMEMDILKIFKFFSAPFK